MVNRLAEQSAAKLASSSGEALNSVRLVPVYGLANFVVGQGPCDPLRSTGGPCCFAGIQLVVPCEVYKLKV